MRLLIAVGVLAWAAGVAWGLVKIQSYSATPGAATVAPASWPGSALVVPKSGRATLVMFIHPQCSCTRASLEELRTILNTAKVDPANGAVSAWVVVLQPVGTSEAWVHSGTWDTARNMPGVTVVTDARGTEADRFGALTSGHTVLYDSAGRLAFTGGITGARGHIGNNVGRASVVSLIETGKADADGHEVFGCGMHDPHPRTDTPVNAAL